MSADSKLMQQELYELARTTTEMQVWLGLRARSNIEGSDDNRLLRRWARRALRSTTSPQSRGDGCPLQASAAWALHRAIANVGWKWTAPEVRAWYLSTESDAPGLLTDLATDGETDPDVWLSALAFDLRPRDLEFFDKAYEAAPTKVRVRLDAALAAWVHKEVSRTKETRHVRSLTSVSAKAVRRVFLDRKNHPGRWRDWVKLSTLAPAAVHVWWLASAPGVNALAAWLGAGGSSSVKDQKVQLILSSFGKAAPALWDIGDSMDMSFPEWVDFLASAWENASPVKSASCVSVALDLTP